MLICPIHVVMDGEARQSKMGMPRAVFHLPVFGEGITTRAKIGMTSKEKKKARATKMVHDNGITEQKEEQGGSTFVQEGP